MRFRGFAFVKASDDSLAKIAAEFKILVTQARPKIYIFYTVWSFYQTLRQLPKSNIGFNELKIDLGGHQIVSIPSLLSQEVSRYLVMMSGSSFYASHFMLKIGKVHFYYLSMYA